MIIRISQIEPWRCVRPAAALKYTKMIKSGHVFPPIQVIKQSGRYRYRLFDGYHRARAVKNSGCRTIRATIIASEL
jgi:uncharacterized ParB-like nuclease family protein